MWRICRFAAGADKGGVKLKEVCVLAFLGVNTWTDIRKKQVSMAAVVVFAVSVLAWEFYAGGISWRFLFPVGIGCFFLAVSLMTRGALGMGDGCLLMALGLGLDIGEFLTVLCVGLLCCALWAIGLLAVCRKGRNTEIPFVPFLLLGYIGGVLLWK